MAFTVKDWKDAPDHTTPITAAALEDLETRVTNWAKAITASSSETSSEAFKVTTDTGHADGSRIRFSIENNAAAALPDLNFRGVTINVGNTSSASSAAGTQIGLYSPNPDSSSALTIYDPGSGSTARTTFKRTGQMDLFGVGVTSRHFGVWATGEGDPRFQLRESGSAVAIQTGPGSSAPDTFLERTAAAVWSVTNAFQFPERTTPSAPPADSVILFAKDNGAGKTQLMAIFSSGAAQQVAIQP